MKQMAIQLGDLDVQQMEGIVVVTFVDHSRCGDAYSFSRQSVDSDMGRVGEENAFTPNYYYMGNRRACDEEINPGFQAADSLLESCLPAGSHLCVWHSRCGQRLRILKTDRAPRQSSIDGSVALSKDAGMLPVARISV